MTARDLVEFEKHVADLWNTGQYPYLIHLGGGNEEWLLDLSKRFQAGDWFISTHRNHLHYLIAGGNPEWLRQQIMDGRSMFIFDNKLNFLSSSIVAGNCAIAVGIAYGLKERQSPNTVWCFVGDGAEDNGHFYESVIFAKGHDLPCTFIVEDNNRSVDTSIAQRRGEHHVPMEWPDNVIRCHYTPTYPHAGSGTTKKIEFKL